MKNLKSTKTLFLLTAVLLSAVACFGQDTSQDQLAGKWIKQLNGSTVTFTISPDLTYEVEFTGDEKPDVWGSCVVSGIQVTFNDEGGEYGADVPGVYEFKVENGALLLKKINDPVGGRSMLVEGSWSGAAKEE